MQGSGLSCLRCLEPTHARIQGTGAAVADAGSMRSMQATGCRSSSWSDTCAARTALWCGIAEGLALVLPIRLDEPHLFENERSVDSALCHRHGLRFSHRLTCRRQTFIEVDGPLPNVMPKRLYYAEFNASMFHTSRRTNSTACSSRKGELPNRVRSQIARPSTVPDAEQRVLNLPAAFSSLAKCRP